MTAQAAMAPQPIGAHPPISQGVTPPHPRPGMAALDDARLLGELAHASANVPEGGVANLDALAARDPLGPAVFAPIARRFGWTRDGMQWRRERIPRWTPGWVTPEHAGAWFDLFEAAFGYRMPEALWQWKYRHNPCPGMGAWRDGRLVAFYGAMQRDVMHFGRLQRTVQIGDVMVHPQERGVMTRNGAFQIAASSFIERSVGEGRPFLFGYGFPTEQALKVAQKLGLYEQVDDIVELAWTPDAPWRARLDRCIPATGAHAAIVDDLWAQMAADFHDDVIGLRDWRYVRERYLSHPVNPYECLLVRRVGSGHAWGLIVIRDRGDEGGIELLDMIGPRHAFARLVRAARRIAAQRRRARCFLWLTGSHAQLLDGTGATRHPLGLVVPANVWTPGPSADSLRGRWWLTGGDADFR